MAYIKLQGNPFNGNKNQFIQFRQSFQIQQDCLVSSQKGMSSTLLHHPSIINELSQAQMKVISTKKKALAANDESVSLLHYKIALQAFEELKNDRDNASIAVTANLMNAITEDVYNSIFAEIEDLTVEYRQPKENFFKLKHYPKLRATWQALENNFLPNISEAMANERIALERLPDKSSLSQIFNAINLYVKRIGTFPVFDHNKNQVLKDGRPQFETPDKRQLKEILERHVKHSSDTMKEYLIGKWTTNATDYDDMYNDLRAYVRSDSATTATTSQTLSASQQIVPYRAAPTSQSLPVISANAAFSDPHDSRPLRTSRKPGLICLNCTRPGHFASFCTSIRCEPCRRTFPDYLERARHTIEAHNNFEPPHSNHNNSSYRAPHHNNPHHYHTQSRSRDRTRSNSRHSDAPQRSFSRDRGSRSRDRSSHSRDRTSKSPNRRSYQNQANSAVSFADNKL